MGINQSLGSYRDIAVGYGYDLSWDPLTGRVLLAAKLPRHVISFYDPNYEREYYTLKDIVTSKEEAIYAAQDWADRRFFSGRSLPLFLPSLIARWIKLSIARRRAAKRKTAIRIEPVGSPETLSFFGEEEIGDGAIERTFAHAYAFRLRFNDPFECAMGSYLWRLSVETPDGQPIDDKGVDEIDKEPAFLFPETYSPLVYFDSAALIRWRGRGTDPELLICSKGFGFGCYIEPLDGAWPVSVAASRHHHLLAVSTDRSVFILETDYRTLRRVVSTLKGVALFWTESGDALLAVSLGAEGPPLLSVIDARVGKVRGTSPLDPDVLVPYDHHQYGWVEREAVSLINEERPSSRVAVDAIRRWVAVDFDAAESILSLDIFRPHGERIEGEEGPCVYARRHRIRLRLTLDHGDEAEQSDASCLAGGALLGENDADVGLALSTDSEMADVASIKLKVATICLRLVTISNTIIALFLLLVLFMVPPANESETALSYAFVATSVIALMFAGIAEWAVRGLRQTKFTAWVVAIIIGALCSVSPLFPIGGALLWAVLSKETRVKFVGR
jgi:hypothetical protein